VSVWLRSLRAGWPAAAIATFVCVWFANKAFNIDDYVFLLMADHMLEDPLHPASVQIVVGSRLPEWAAAGMWSGPVMPTLLVPSVAAGGAEWLAHLAMLAVLLLGVFSTAALGLRLGLDDRGARWAALLVVGSAGVLGMATTCMPDVPTMSFAVLGAERIVALRDRPRVTTWIGTAVAFALCLLSRQHGVVVMACMVPVLIATWPRNMFELGAALRQRAILASIAAILGALVLVFVTYAIMRDPRVESGLTTPTKIAKLHMLPMNLANVPAQWVLTFPLGLAWLYLHGRRMLRTRYCWIAALVGVGLAITTTQDLRHEWTWMWWEAPVTALGTAVLVDAVVDAIARRDLVDFALAGWLLMAAPVAIYAHLPPKYLVPSVPAMAVLLMRHVARRPSFPSLKVFGGVVAQGIVLGMLIISADAAHAETGRVGGEIVAKYIARNERVFFDGSWGFQWYAMNAGARAVTTDEASWPQAGDVVVLGQENRIIRGVPFKRHLIWREKFTGPGGRVMHRPAGFYSNWWGPLPWRISWRQFQAVEVWKILDTPKKKTPEGKPVDDDPGE
jgi:hypothetical protein